jgi:hypothetical protein
MRKRAFIKINNYDDIKTFVDLASKVNCGDVDVIRGKYCIDARSFLGVLGVDMSTGVTVEYPAEALEFENFILAFATEESN